MKNYWIMKSEPDVYGINNLESDKNDFWDGIRNYQARNFMRDTMKIGDFAFFYHSSCKEPGIYGIMEIISNAYPDLSAQNPNSKYYDGRASLDNPIWLGVDVAFIKVMDRPILLSTLKSQDYLNNMQLLKKGNRLSILPVAKDQWDYILTL